MLIQLKNIQAQWGSFLEGLKYSTDDFYTKLASELQSHNVEGIKTKVVTLKEKKRLFSSGRKYLRVKWKRYVYDICFAPFGNGMFVSSWLYMEPSLIQKILMFIPFIGPWIVSYSTIRTFYQEDTEGMFMSYAQKSILRVVDELAESQNIKSIPEHERRVILSNKIG